MPDPRPYDCVVIGGGPAGIFAAYTLARAGVRTVLLEAGAPMVESLCPKIKLTLAGRVPEGSERFRMQCRRCTCLTGLGGAAFHFDTNLGYASALQRSKIEQGPDTKVKTFSTLARALGSFERAEEAVREVFGILHHFGLPVAGPTLLAGRSIASGRFDAADLSASQSITLDTALIVIENLMRAFVASGGEVRFRARATSLCRGSSGFRFKVNLETGDGSPETLAADFVVVAVGKLGLPWVRQAIEQLQVEVNSSTKVDVGVRLEGPRERLLPLSASCSNPKFAFLNDRGESVRTFCVCAGGRIMQYEFGDAIILDGQHCLTSPTKRSNFGIVTTTRVPNGSDGTDFALNLARRVTEVGNGRPVACTVGEIRHDRVRGGERPSGGLDTSLIDYKHCSLAQCLPATLRHDILGMIERLNEAFPSLIGDSAVLAAPVIERIYPQLVLSDAMESSAPGLHFVGDASSKIIGITYGAATGKVAAEKIAQSAALRSLAR